MTILDAEYLEHSTYVDYNKPKFSNLLERDLDNTKVRADLWLLKPQYIPAKATTFGGNDLTYNKRSVVVVGTELQIYNKFCEMIEKYGWQLQDSWDRELKPSWNKHYENNGEIPIVINLI